MADQPPVLSPPPKPVKKLTAWLCLLLNALVLPGLGSLIVRNPVKGIAQGVLAVAGMVLSMAGVGPTLDQMVKTGELPDHVGGTFWLSIVGIILFAIAWVWAFMSSVSTIAKSGNKRPQ
ncbi:MAG TPA: hypothetical protein VMV72_15680 [Verrucomicrobiae bacterium]|nr:hypothetical protein [Verrucomicrobiae bacterium]